ncbi:hypothetical protein DN597_24590 [Enterobacter cloacae]|nr:hypothetical protein DN597_24590 [Enterobacter cloacae]
MLPLKTNAVIGLLIFRVGVEPYNYFSDKNKSLLFVRINIGDVCDCLFLGLAILIIHTKLSMDVLIEVIMFSNIAIPFTEISGFQTSQKLYILVI